jgi:translation initiation factor IF-3
MDFGKFKYETQKREAEARKNQKIIEIKEIKFRPNTDTHDYEVKMRSVMKFLEEWRQGEDDAALPRPRDGTPAAGACILLEPRCRRGDRTSVGKVENMPRLEGRQMVMMIGPTK